MYYDKVVTKKFRYFLNECFHCLNLMKNFKTYFEKDKKTIEEIFSRIYEKIFGTFIKNRKL